jgi:hypothetical protein
LYLSVEPLGKYFLLKIHLQPIGFARRGKSTISQVRFCKSELISTFIASFQNKESEKEIALEYAIGSSSTR